VQRVYIFKNLLVLWSKCQNLVNTGACYDVVMIVGYIVLCIDAPMA
jgi:hypothetical protein